MKRLREVLLAKHGKAGPDLDAIRQRVVAGLSAERGAGEDASAAGVPQVSSRAPARPGTAWTWREVLHSWRWHSAGLAAAWLLVLLLNAASGAAPTPVIARENMLSSKEIQQAIRLNRAQFLEGRSAANDDRAFPAAPSPAPARRSERPGEPCTA